MKEQQGFTLVEMLVASSIMMAVLLIATTSYGFFHDRWSKQNNAFYQQVVEKKNQLMLLDVLRGTLPFVVNQQGSSSYLFVGTQESVEFVTEAPVFTEGTAFVQLSVVSVGDGTYQVLYKEAPITDRQLVLSGVKPEFKYEKVFFEDLRLSGFRYLGWRSLEDKNLFHDTREGLPEWINEYSGEAIRAMPQAIAITLDQQVLRFLVPDDNSYMVTLSADLWGDT
ncbi:prepilin-type N-terminal cleavage/methylation domain-containing protein [Aliagarivorans marinus]|uniref:prepilin-type N-terminal cleavage/methylation domain-containing protein n=1 Tax=Aliagarivorans marinus TaxID=561965 RepID=UPI00047B6CB0|nr:prepilin-type N-terminal cleavage/methylation domain-containing protein [Aliagarivorans marinus]